MTTPDELLDDEIQNTLVVEKDRTFQLLPDYSLLKLGEQNQLLVYLPEADMFVGVSRQMENGFSRRLRNVIKHTVNYISVDDWKVQRQRLSELERGRV